MPKTGVHWFRHGLRIHDNPALYACVEEVERFVPIFIFDGKVAGTEICGFVRYRFLLQSLKDLEKQFAKYGIPFMCFYGEADQVLEKLIKEWDIRFLSFEKDSESIWRKRDNAVKKLCARSNVQVIERATHTLYDPDNIFSMNDDIAPESSDELMRFCEKLGKPSQPEPKPNLKFFRNNLRSAMSLYDADVHKVPELDRFNIVPECKEQEVCLFEGGETKALQLFKKRILYEKECFKHGEVHPNIKKGILFSEEISFSPYLRFGCLSVRKFYWDIKKAYNRNFTGEEKGIEPSEQLYWREYFYQLSYKNENFAKIDGNPMCYKIPWDNEDKKEIFTKWEMGQTGYPWIDASMRQLRQEGWIHHVCRNSVAVFLTRGDLFLSWEQGLKTFLYYQIDADWSVCSGNWNWISSGDPAEALNPTIAFCPINHGKSMDPTGAYIRKYVPELKDFPLEHLFDPWRASLEEQEAAHCIIGKDYPEPCVNHADNFRENFTKLQQYYHSCTPDIYNQVEKDKNELEKTNFHVFYNFTNEMYKALGIDFD